MRAGPYLICLFLACYPGEPFAQAVRDYSKADQFAGNPPFSIHSKTELDSFIRLADRRFSDTADKVRVVFYWIAKNLAYDCDQDRQAGQRKYGIDDILARQRSTCAGYSSLLHYGLSKMGITCVTIHGIAKTSRKDLAEGAGPVRPNHDWNAVRIGGAWRLLDPTWASGAADDDCKTIIREFEGFYFFPDPSQFALSHFPNEETWQLTDTIMTREGFLQLPLFRDPYYEMKVNDFNPRRGILYLKKNDLIMFRFTSERKLEKIALWTDDLPGFRPVFGNFTRKGDEYSYAFRVDRTGEYFLNLSLDGSRCAMIYRLVVENNSP